MWGNEWNDQEVKNAIIASIINNGYFSFSVYSTPVISHADQLTLIIIYLSLEDGLASERVLTFLEQKDHSAEMMADLLFNCLITEFEIDPTIQHF